MLIVQKLQIPLGKLKIQKKIIKYSVWLLLCFVPLGFAEENHILTKQEAAKIAAIHVAKLRIDTANFRTPKVLYDEKYNEWHIYYNAIVTKPGGHFSIIVNDKTKEAKLFPGF